MNEPWFNIALEHTRAAVAMIDGLKAVRVTNRAFRAVAQSVGCSAEELALRLAESDLTGDESLHDWHVEVREIDQPPGARLLELTPVAVVAQGVVSNTTAQREPLTGLLSRPAFVERLTNRLSDPRRDPFAVLFIDLDGFKAINDQLGHLAGDECLKRIGRRLPGVLRSADSVGRYGGDEFIALVEGVASEEDAVPVCRRLAEAIARPIDYGGKDWRLGVSIGPALSSEGFATPEAMIDAADQRMYEEKRRRAARSIGPESAPSHASETTT